MLTTRCMLAVATIIAMIACGGQAVSSQQACPATQALCGNACATLRSDPTNCGSCGNVCASEQVCDNGACRTLQCTGGTVPCATDAGAYCTNTQSDNDNCGSCGNACSAGNVCSNSACAPTCFPDTTYCGKANGCVSLATDSGNCGSCGATCIGACVGGACVAATAIAAGNMQTCALLTDQSVWWWGDDLSGQLGDGNVTNSSLPARVLGVTATAVTAGGNFSCAFDYPNTAMCWGDNTYGELGIGNTTPQASAVTIDTTIGQPYSGVSAGSVFACAPDVGGSGAVKCWGSNNVGQLGDGTMAERDSPVYTQNLYYVSKVTTGAGHSCAIWGNSLVKCWGGNYWGELGLGESDSNAHPTPASISTLSGVKDIAAGGYFTCAILADSSVDCWGLYGVTPVSVPTPIGVSNAVSISAGTAHACAVLADTTVKCWGSNQNGELGDASVAALTGVTAVAAGGAHTCAIVNGSVMCWGLNQTGQLGNGTLTNSSSAVTVK